MKDTQNLPSMKHIAQLANLNVSTEKLAELEKSLRPVIAYMDEVARLDLHDVPATSRILDEENVWREDKVGESQTQEQALQNAQRTHQGYFVVDHIFADRDE